MKVFLLTIALLGVFGSPLPAATLVVPIDHATIAAALEHAQPGDTVLIQPGQYEAVGLQLPVGVSLKGAGADPGETILDGQNAGRILTCEGQTSASVIENLTFRRGWAWGLTSYDGSGGAILCSNGDVLIRVCHFENNTAQYHGGAIRSSHASPWIEDCVFSGNRAAGGGGALDCSYGSNPVVINGVFRGNWAAWGGGVSCRADSHPRLEKCVLEGNVAMDTPGLGGAVFSDFKARPVLTQTILCDNIAKNGGGVASLGVSGVNLHMCTLVGNMALSQGGGFFLCGAKSSVFRSVISFNRGGSLHLRGTAQMELGCTDIFGNTGGDWVPAIRKQKDHSGNLHADPLFCTMERGMPGRFAPRADSPLVTDQGPCKILGALPVGCAVSAVKGSVPTMTVAGLAAHPNPFNPRTSINFQLTRDAHVRVRVHDVHGAVVHQLVDAPLAAGHHTLSWKGVDAAGRALAAGTYLVVAEANGEQLVTKVALIK
ncbi:hypothetical protein CSB20_00220 [bacterium DOLZORAL124_64_63]|nr:MAG: hypothetical protein CSB20_00220 [bacterium DOLZORAL124_64_63]